MSESFGTRLRRERERRQVTLASIAESTKITVSLLAALEHDDLSRWPPGVFRRAFVRAYAEAIGLDPDAVWREFSFYFPQSSEPPAPAAPYRLTGSAAPLRLLLADDRLGFLSRALAEIPRRWRGVVWDVGLVLLLALGSFAIFDRFWMPLGVTALGYYGCGVLVLGTTLGARLFEPRAKAHARRQLRLLVSQTGQSAGQERQHLVAGEPDEAAGQPSHRAAG